MVGLFSASMWMPYLIALIYLNGLWKKLNYEPLTAEKPKWVDRAMVAHNNSLENFMLFATSVIFACLMMKVPEKEVRAAAAFYFVCR